MLTVNHVQKQVKNGLALQEILCSFANVQRHNMEQISCTQLGANLIYTFQSYRTNDLNLFPKEKNGMCVDIAFVWRHLVRKLLPDMPTNLDMYRILGQAV
jgi:hypothetical protein